MEAGYIGLTLMQPDTHCRDGIGEARQESGGRVGREKDGEGGEGCMGVGWGGGGGEEKVA